MCENNQTRAEKTDPQRFSKNEFANYGDIIKYSELSSQIEVQLCNKVK